MGLDNGLASDRPFKFWITAWPKLMNKARESGNMSIKYTGSYFTAVEASSALPLESLDCMCLQNNTIPLQWRHNERDCVSNHRRLVNIFFMMTSANGNIFRVTGTLCEEFTVHWLIPLTKASDAENVYICWRHHEKNRNLGFHWKRHMHSIFMIILNIYTSPCSRAAVDKSD